MTTKPKSSRLSFKHDRWILDIIDIRYWISFSSTLSGTKLHNALPHLVDQYRERLTWTWRHKYWYIDLILRVFNGNQCIAQATSYVHWKLKQVSISFLLERERSRTETHILIFVKQVFWLNSKPHMSYCIKGIIAWMYLFKASLGK